MAVRNARSKSATHWIPPEFTAKHKLTIERSDGTVDDITSYVYLFEYEDGVTDTIGGFELQISNATEQYTDKWTFMDIVRFYCDYATSATTLRFRGRIEKIDYTNNIIKISGRSEALAFMDITVTKSYQQLDCSDILKDLIDNYGKGNFTYNNIDTSNVIITINWYQKPFWECVTELCTATGYFAYVDSNLDFHFKLKGGVDNTQEAIVHTYNLISVSEFSEDITQVKNRIKVYGAQQDGIQLIYTVEDKDSITSYKLREDILQNNNMTNYNQIKEYGNYILETKKNPPVTGEVIGTLLASIQPGERIRLSSPENKLPPGYYDIIGFKQTIDFNSGLYTTVKVNKEPQRYNQILKTLIQNGSDTQTTDINKFDLDFTYNLLFNEDTGVHSNTQIVDGLLKPTAVGGVYISDSFIENENITQVNLLVVGSNVPDVKFEITGNGGVSYIALRPNNLTNLSSVQGRDLKIRITFNTDTPEIDSISIQFKKA
jgi:hypothetical protein